MIFHKEIQINFMQTASELIIEMECTFLLYCENIIEKYMHVQYKRRGGTSKHVFKFLYNYHQNIACIFSLRENE